MMAKCAGKDLPGHRIVAALQKAKAEKEEEFYQTLITADNLINKQTQASEDIARARKAKDGQGWRYHIRCQHLSLAHPIQHQLKIIVKYTLSTSY
jgi:hypothetical protein